MSEECRSRAPRPAFIDERPQAPSWFVDALAASPERRFVEVGGAEIEALSWGRRGAPGLMFLHGHGAHADWWSFIAPFLAADMRITAMSWSGMGRSGWRDDYSICGYTNEMFAVAEATGLYDDSRLPVFVGHSFGATPVVWGAARDRMRLAVIVDSGARIRSSPSPRPPGQPRIFATEAEALARFRLRRSSQRELPFLVDFVARRSVRRVRTAEGGEAWASVSDPWVRSRLGVAHQDAMKTRLAEATANLAFVMGDRSQLLSAEDHALTRKILGSRAEMTIIPGCGHHVMLDDPLAFIAALSALLTAN